MASFEVAVQDPTPLFESLSLCGIFDVCLSVCVRVRVRMCVYVYALNMLSRYVYVHAHVPDDVLYVCEQIEPLLS